VDSQLGFFGHSYTPTDEQKDVHNGGLMLFGFNKQLNNSGFQSVQII